MTIFLAVCLLVLGILIFIYAIIILIRNDLVYSERTIMHKIIFLQENWEHWLNISEQVSYNQMMSKFWVFPVHKLWPEKIQELRKRYPL